MDDVLTGRQSVVEGVTYMFMVSGFYRSQPFGAPDLLLLIHQVKAGAN